MTVPPGDDDSSGSFLESITPSFMTRDSSDDEDDNDSSPVFTDVESGSMTIEPPERTTNWAYSPSPSEFSIDTEAIQRSIEARIEAEEIQRELVFDRSEGSFTFTTKDDKIKTGRPLAAMEENSIHSWFVEQAYETAADPTVVGERFADGGYAGLRQRVLEETVEEIKERARDRGSDKSAWVGAFNRTTNEWPHRARGYMAAYCADHDDEITNETFNEKLEEFAEAIGVMDYETEQTTFDCFYPTNPYADESLTRMEAKAVVLLRANDEDESIIEDVALGDTENFIGWYKKTGDPDSAIRACLFDSDIPEAIAPKLAEPDNWTEHDPTDIQSGTCAHCGNEQYEVETAAEGACWIDEYGGVQEVHSCDRDSSYSIIDGPGGVFCENCASNWRENTRVVTLFDGENVARSGTSRGVRRDWGHDSESLYTPLSELTTNQRELIEQAPNVSPDGYFQLSLGDVPGRGPDSPGNSAADEVLELAAEDPSRFFGEGTILIVESPTHSGYSRWLLLPRSNPQAARDGKELLDDADEIIANV